MKIIIANWKMNGSVDFAYEFMENINPINTRNTIVVCPPTGLISKFCDFRYHIGAQNCFFEEQGAFTGENSPKLLKEIGCRYIIVGHSERRAIFNETNEIVFKKWEAVIKQGVIPVVCIGETAAERDNWQNVLSTQLRPFLGKTLGDTIFAYEPVWSIGTGVVPTCEEIESVLAFIKGTLGKDNPLLYGGSVNAKNAEQILNCKNVDGVLIGGASLKIDEFKKIISIE